MQFMDKALARRLEAVEEMPQVLYARVFQKTRPEVGAAEEEICGGHMIFAGLGSPIGRATGVGLDRPLTADDVDRIEQFYRKHKAPSQVDLCPMHDATVFEMFKQRGYAIAELNNVLYRKLDPEEKLPPPPAGCDICRGKIEEAAIASAIVEVAFFPDGAPEAYGRSWQESMARSSPAPWAWQSPSTGCSLSVGLEQWPSFVDAAFRPRCYTFAWPPQRTRDANMQWC
jgi:hypothetical protein